MFSLSGTQRWSGSMNVDFSKTAITWLKLSRPVPPCYAPVALSSAPRNDAVRGLSP